MSLRTFEGSFGRPVLVPNQASALMLPEILHQPSVERDRALARLRLGLDELFARGSRSIWAQSTAADMGRARRAAVRGSDAKESRSAPETQAHGQQ